MNYIETYVRSLSGVPGAESLDSLDLSLNHVYLILHHPHPVPKRHPGLGQVLIEGICFPCKY